MTGQTQSPAPPGPRRSRRGGDRAIVPVERLSAYLERRRRSGVPMSAGEVVTILVALARDGDACPAPAPRGDWWLTAHGRPVRTADDGTGASASGDVFRALAELAPPSVRGLVGRARDALVPIAPLGVAQLERLAFEAAPPEPLVLGPLVPLDQEEDGEGEKREVALLQAWDDGVLPLLRHLVDRVRKSGGGRKRPASAMIAGVGVAVFAVVVALGLLLWPDRDRPGGGSDPAATASAPPAVEAAPLAETSPFPGPTTAEERPRTPSPEVRAPTDDEASSAPTSDEASSGTAALDAARVLFAEFARCGGDAGCTQTLRESPSASGDEEVLSPNDSVTLVDDFGGLMVVRLDRGDRRQYVTLVRVNGRWLVRAAEAVTDQPS